MSFDSKTQSLLRGIPVRTFGLRTTQFQYILQMSGKNVVWNFIICFFT